MTEELAAQVNQYGFPIIAAMGLGYFVFYIWKWVTTDVKPVLGQSQKTLIKLVDRIRMLDNDMIRLNTKLQMVLEMRNKGQLDLDTQSSEDLEEIINRYASRSENFDQDPSRHNKPE